MILLNAGASTANLAFQYLIGWLFTRGFGDDVLYLYAVCAAAMCLLIVPMQIYASKRGNRYVKPEDVDIKLKTMNYTTAEEETKHLIGANGKVD